MSGETLELARGKWRGILIHFGIDAARLDGKHGPCPLCDAGKDRFRYDDKDGSGSYFCSACGAGTGMQLLMAYRGWAFPRAAFEIDAVLGRIPTEQHRAERTDEDKGRSLKAMWEGSGRVLPETAAWSYLTRRCGALDGLMGDLRAHPGLRHPDGGTHPGMLAVLRYADGKGASIHRTFLGADGQKAAVDPVRMMMPGFSLEGAAVRLGPLQKRIGIAEGIETAICAGKLFGLPVWAAVSANGMRVWDVPLGVESVVVCGDHDLSFTGQAAAFELARKLKAKGLTVEVMIPPIPGMDWQDVWSEQNKSGA